jgi:hypothetical protein
VDGNSLGHGVCQSFVGDSETTPSALEERCLQSSGSPSEGHRRSVRKKEAGSELRGKYFVLDDEVRSTPVSYDEDAQDKIWESISKDLGTGNGL